MRWEQRSAPLDLAEKLPERNLGGGAGAGVFEVIENLRTDTYRAVYTVRLQHAVYVLHAFQKRSRRGITTVQRTIEMVERRLRSAR